MKKLLAVLFIFASAFAFGQQKRALVIGNSNYVGISSLKNPVNDASDIEAALKRLGFTVKTVLDGSYTEMENAIMNFEKSLRASKNTYGFFFYAGHGVQADGSNYLIPVRADSIRSESHLREQAVSLNTILDNLDKAGNELNIIVLDACRDNPFGWSRSAGRGLSVVSHQPSGSIIMYATAANTKADDGQGRNSPFTAHLLNNLRANGLSVYEVFEKTMGDVIRASGGKQHPEIRSSYSRASKAYLGQSPPPEPVPHPRPAPEPGPVPPPRPNPEPSPFPSAKDYFDKGCLFTQRRDWDLAIAEYNQALKLDASYAEAYYGRGMAYTYKRRFDQAIIDFNKAITLYPNYAEAYYGRGMAYTYKRRFDQAIIDFNKAITLHPNYAEAYYGRGMAYNNKRDFDRAIRDFNQAIRINPDYAEACYNRGMAYERKGNRDQANADYARARELGHGGYRLR